MKNIRILALLTGFGWCCGAYAAVDCNQPNLEYLNDAYVCLNSSLKTQNNQIQKIENELQQPPENLRRELSLLEEKMAKATGDDVVIKKERKELTQKMENLNRRLEEARKDADEKHIFIRRVRDKGRNCRSEKCMAEVYGETLAGLQGFSRQKGCSLPELSENCEIYVYNKPSQNKTNTDILLSAERNTYEEKVRINRPGKCVYLFLSSPNPQIWDILTTDQTDLRMIYAGGDYPQLVRGYPDTAKVEVHHRGELLKTAENCLRATSDLEQKQGSSFLNKLGIAAERRNYVFGGKIGDNAPIGDYRYYPENTKGASAVTVLPPAEEGWEKLLADGKVRRLTHRDIERFKKNGIINLDNNKFVWRRSDYRDFFQMEDMLLKGGYILLEDIRELPRGSNAPVFVFIGGGQKAPLNMKLDPVFGGSEASKVDIFSHSFLILPVEKDDLPLLPDCDRPRGVVDKVICADDGLRAQKNRLDETFERYRDEKPDMINAYQTYAVLRLRNCRTKTCAKETMEDAVSWLKNQNYLKETETAAPVLCQLKDIKPDCEVYAYSAYRQGQAMKGVYLSDDNETFNTQVKINQPGKCVVLFLSAYEPVVWDIYTTPATDLQAVIVGGHYEQMLRGMKPDVQTKVRNGNYLHEGNDVCLQKFYGKDEIVDAVRTLNLGIKDIRLLDKPVIGEEVDDKFYEYNPQVIDGEFIKPDIAPADAGLQQLEKDGFIRPIVASDKDKIKAAGYSCLLGDEERGPFGYRSYVMLKQFPKLPGGLTGGSSIVLLVPEGLNAPENNDGHNTFFRINLTADELADKKADNN